MIDSGLETYARAEEARPESSPAFEKKRGKKKKQQSELKYEHIETITDRLQPFWVRIWPRTCV